ncbi:MAG TPA: GNAT family N-acetyltransferase [Kamptonema sp.]|nr:GNAT family N-acetyltransferase [Kamptonema sp.]
MKIKPAPRIVVTDRTVFVQPKLDYFPEIYGILSNPKVMQFVTTGTRSKSEAKKETIDWMKHWKKHGFGPYLVLDKREANLIGFAKLYLSSRSPWVQIGYAIDDHLWGIGIGSEIAKSLLKIGFENLGEEALAGFARVENLASRRVLEKVGFELQTENFRQENRVYAHYTLDAADYFQRQGFR